jgi:hypothetical protein
MAHDEEALGRWMLLNRFPQDDVYVGTERRAHKRRPVDERGQLVIPSEHLTLPCVIANASDGGAKIVCDAIPATGTRVILIFSNGSCFEAETARFSEGELGLKYIASAEQR